jgi:ATP-dependent RNA helicase DHX29
MIVNDKMHKSGRLDWNEDLVVNSDDEDTPTGEQVVKFEKRYSQQTISTLNRFDERLIPYDLIVRLLERICFEDGAHAPYSAAVLVFMPGLNEIRKLTDMLGTHELFGGNAFRVYPLHSTISTEDQGAVFNVPPAGVRKIVIGRSRRRPSQRFLNFEQQPTLRRLALRSPISPV